MPKVLASIPKRVQESWAISWQSKHSGQASFKMGVWAAEQLVADLDTGKEGKELGVTS